MNVGGRSAFVTGAASGIGLALAERLAAAGARVTATDLDEQAVAGLAERLGPAHLAPACDVTDEAALAGCLEETAARLGPVEIFCANAGVATGGDAIETTDAVWDRTLAVNLRAHVTAARLVLPGWLERGEGCFVSVASAAALLTQIGSAPYAVSKHAALAFAEWLAVTYGDSGVRVSCVCPMGVRTAMLEPGRPGALDELGARVVRQASDLLDPERVADMVIEAIEEERFLVLPHPEVLDFFRRKADDYDRWLAGMRRLQASTGAVAGGAGS